MFQYFASAVSTRAGFVQQPSRSVTCCAEGKRTVLVTGAGGKTGKLVAKKVKESDKLSLRALCRTEEVRTRCKLAHDQSCAQPTCGALQRTPQSPTSWQHRTTTAYVPHVMSWLHVLRCWPIHMREHTWHPVRLQSKAKLQSELGLEEGECVVADVVNKDLSEAMKGCDAMVVATSATPKIVYTSLPGFMWKRFVMKEKVMPSFTFPQAPEEVRHSGPAQPRRACDAHPRIANPVATSPWPPPLACQYAYAGSRSRAHASSTFGRSQSVGRTTSRAHACCADRLEGAEGAV